MTERAVPTEKHPPDSPCFLLSGRVLRDVIRCLSYGWNDALIVSLIRRRHGSRITGRCVEAIRKDSPCPPKCREHCRLRLDT